SFFFSIIRRHTRCLSDWSSDVCSSDLERMVFPTVAVVHHHLGIPLREVEAPPLAHLAPRQGGWTRLPVDLDRQRIAGAEGSRQEIGRESCRVRGENVAHA